MKNILGIDTTLSCQFCNGTLNKTIGRNREFYDCTKCSRKFSLNLTRIKQIKSFKTLSMSIKTIKGV